jgi:NDP-sugar pyrophosphorylase family protein
MQAVILAAGKGTRMLPLTQSTPKPMLLVASKPILERIVDALPEEITEIIIIVGYLSEQIESHFGTSYKGRTIRYIQQAEPQGTYSALELAKPFITGTFLVLNADDMHGSEAFAEAITHPLVLLVARHEEPTKFGVVSQNADGTLRGIIEKPESTLDTLVSTGAMVLDERIFEYNVEPAANGERYLPKALEQLAADATVVVVEQSEWTPLGYPEDIAEAEKHLAE